MELSLQQRSTCLFASIPSELFPEHVKQETKINKLTFQVKRAQNQQIMEEPFKGKFLYEIITRDMTIIVYWEIFRWQAADRFESLPCRFAFVVCFEKLRCFLPSVCPLPPDGLLVPSRSCLQVSSLSSCFSLQ